MIVTKKSIKQTLRSQTCYNCDHFLENSQGICVLRFKNGWKRFQIRNRIMKIMKTCDRWDPSQS